MVESDRVASVDLRAAPPEPPPQGMGSSDPGASSATVSDVSGHRRVLEDFLRAIETDSTPVCDGREGRRSVEVAEAIYRSARSGTAVSLRQEPPIDLASRFAE